MRRCYRSPAPSHVVAMVDMPPPMREVVRVKMQSWVKNAGKSIPLDLKCWRYSCGKVHWETRSVLQCFFVDTVKWQVTKVLEKSMAAVKECLAGLGEEMHYHFFPSWTAYQAKKDAYDLKHVDPNYIRNEYSASTFGLICWLSTWSQCRKSDEDKDVARAMLLALFFDKAPSWMFFDVKLLEVFDTVFNVCPARNSQRVPCRHIRYFLRDVGGDNAHWDWSDFLDMYQELMCDDTCGASLGFFNKLTFRLAHAIDGSVFDALPADPLKDSIGYHVVDGKKRRIDEDFKAALTGLTVQSGIKPVQVCKFTGVASEWVSGDAMQNFVKAHIVAGKNQLTCKGVVCACDDSSGHGKPKESTQVGVIYDARANKAGVVQPMVPPHSLPWLDSN